jgi:hypothetical protein
MTDDKTCLYRVDLDYTHNNNAFTDFVTNQNAFIGPTITYHPIEQFRFNLEAEYQNTIFVDNANGFPDVGTGPAPLPITRYVSQPEVTVNYPNRQERELADRVVDKRVDIGRRHAGDRTRGGFPVLRDHRRSGPWARKATASGAFPPRYAVGEFCLNSVEQLPLKDRRVLAFVGLATFAALGYKGMAIITAGAFPHGHRHGGHQPLERPVTERQLATNARKSFL